MKILLVGLGGFVGSIFRYLIAGWIHKITSTTFPYGTLAVNVIGCAFIGFLMFLTEEQLAIGSSMRLFLGIGLLGGFTTFSTFGYETIELLKDNQLMAAGGYICANVILGVGAVGLVYLLMKQLNG